MSRNLTRQPRRVLRRKRPGQPYFLFGLVLAIAVLFGVQQVTGLQRQLVAGMPLGGVDARDLQIETTQVESPFVVNGDPADEAGGPVSADSLPALSPLVPVESHGIHWVGPDPVPFVIDPVLAARVGERVRGRSGRYGVAIKDLRSGRGVLIDADSRYEAASLFKLTVMYEVFKQREAGTLSFSEVLLVTPRHVEFDLGTIDRPAGSYIGIGDAVERMITISDNSSAILLTDRVGAGNITQDMNNLGLTRTRLLLDDLSTSPADMLLLLEAIARGEAINRTASADMIHLMARQRVNDRIPRLLPAGTIVAHKTGNLPGVVNDVGIVYGGDQVFVVAVMIEGTPNDGEATRITSELAAIAYEHFNAAARGEVTLRAMGELVPEPEPWPTARPTPTPAPTPLPTATFVPEADETPTITATDATRGPRAAQTIAASTTPSAQTGGPASSSASLVSPTGAAPLSPAPASATATTPAMPLSAPTETARPVPVAPRSIPGVLQPPVSAPVAAEPSPAPTGEAAAPTPVR